MIYFFIVFYKLNVIKKKMFIWKLEISSLNCLNEIFSTPVSCSLETTPYTIFLYFFLLYGHLEITGLGWNCTCGDLSATMQVEYIVRMGTKVWWSIYNKGNNLYCCVLLLMLFLYLLFFKKKKNILIMKKRRLSFII